MWRPAAWLGAMVAILLLGGAPAASGAASASQPPTQVRVVNALPTVPVLDVLVDGVPRVPALEFGANAPYVPVAAGSHSIALLPPGGVPPVPLLSTELTMVPGTSQTLFAIQGEGVSPIFLVLPEAPPGVPGVEAAARFVHASPNTPPVDLALRDGPVLFGNVAFGQASPYVPVPPGAVDLETRLAGTPTIVLDIPAVELAPGRVYTFGALGLTEGAPPLGFIALSDL